MLVLAGTPLRADVIMVELPPDIKTVEQLQSARVDSIVDSVIRNVPDGVEDVAILFTRNGRVLTPEDFGIHEDFSRFPARDIEPERGDGWTDTEWNQVLHVWNLAYPRLKRIYGWPYCKCGGFLCRGVHKVKITKDSSMEPKGLFIPRPTCWINSEIKLKGWESMYGRRWGPVLIHEMAHAFRNYRVLPYSQFEEGHAEFAKEEVSTLIYDETGEFHDYPYLYHDVGPYLHGYYILFQQWNTDFIGLPYNDFSVNSGLSAYRYKIAGFSWWKLWFRVPSYFVQFNSWLFSRDYILPPSYDESKNKTREIVGSTRLEDNLPFNEWWTRQYALRSTYFSYYDDICMAFTLGLLAIPDYKSDTALRLRIRVFSYWRYNNGYMYEERPIPGRNIRVKVWDVYGNKVKDTTLPTHNIEHNFLVHSLSRGVYKVEAYIEREYNFSTCRHLIQERVVPVVNAPLSNLTRINPDLSFVALVFNTSSSTLHVTPPGIDVPTVDGMIFFGSTIKRGRWQIYDNVHNDRYSLIIKDEAPYIVYPGGWSKVPPPRPKDLSIRSIDTMHKRVTIVWDNVDDIDLYYYKWKWTLFATSISDSGITTTNSVTLTLGCGTYSIVVSAYDRDGNESPVSEPIFVRFCGGDDRDDDPYLSSKSDRNHGQITVYDVNGRIVYKGDNMDEARLKRGIYFIRQGNRLTKEVIK